MFHPGISGNTRGRPSGSVNGRAQTLATLDRMLSEECNQQVLFDALEKEFQADPAKFFRNTVVPLSPRSMREAPPPDANDDWLPLARRPPFTPPPGPGPCPTPPPLPPTPGKESSCGIPGLPPTVLRPQLSVFSPQSSVLRPPTSPLLSFTCYLLLLIPFALKTDQMPHPVRVLADADPDRLSRIVDQARVPVKGASVRDPRPCQPAPKEPYRLRMNGSGPVLLSAARSPNGRANPVYPCYSLLLIPLALKPAQSALTPWTAETCFSLPPFNFKPFPVDVPLSWPTLVKKCFKVFHFVPSPISNNAFRTSSAFRPPTSDPGPQVSLPLPDMWEYRPCLNGRSTGSSPGISIWIGLGDDASLRNLNHNPDLSVGDISARHLGFSGHSRAARILCVPCVLCGQVVCCSLVYPSEYG